MLEDNKMISAVDIVRNPSIVSNFTKKYKIMYDQTLGGFKLDNLNNAIGLMADRGWRCVNITTVHETSGMKGLYMYALMEKTEKIVP